MNTRILLPKYPGGRGGSPHPADQALQITSLRQRQNRRMIRRRSTNLQHLHPPPRIRSRRRNHLGELRQRNMVRTRTSHQRPTRRQHLHRPQIQLLIPAHRALGRPLRLRKRRRVEHDRVVPLTIRLILAQQLERIGLNPIHLRLEAPDSTPDSDPPPPAPRDSHRPPSPARHRCAR